MASGDAPQVAAFPFGANPGVKLQPAARWRDWMEATSNRNANRCLPLLMANESGWVLLNPHTFRATWNGDRSPAGIAIEYPGGTPPLAKFVESGFGHGVVTWSIPYLFRTSPGYNLLARGPANWPKDGISPLEGLVETDWAVATFTMNWKLTRPDHPVTFEEDEPFCMVVPQKRGELESFQPEFRSFGSDPATREATREWRQRRHRLGVNKFLSEYSRQFEEYRDEWERDYFKGRYPNGSRAHEHQTKLRLKPFSVAAEDADQFVSASPVDGDSAPHPAGRPSTAS